MCFVQFFKPAKAKSGFVASIDGNTIGDGCVTGGMDASIDGAELFDAGVHPILVTAKRNVAAMESFIDISSSNPTICWAACLVRCITRSHNQAS